MSDATESNIENDMMGRPDLSSPPHEQDIPYEAYMDFDSAELSPQDQVDMDIYNALTGLDIAQLDSAPPDLFINPPAELQDGEKSPLAKFLVEQINAVDQAQKQTNPNAKDISLDTAFPKNTQTQWFSEYNQSVINEGNPGGILISKLNGYFFTNTETPEEALTSFGFPPEKSKELASHFQMSFFGNTRARTKNNNGKSNGFKSYVLHLKDPENKESIQLLNEVMATKEAAVQEKLARSYDLNKAVEFLTTKADRIIQEEVQKTGEQPFVGAPGSLFLNPSALRAEINEKSPELKGQFNIEPLDAKGNKVTYTGYSEGLTSYFEDELKICKITTKNAQTLPQDELVRIISASLQLNNEHGHVAETPVDALIQQVEKNTPSEKAQDFSQTLNSTGSENGATIDTEDQFARPEKKAKSKENGMNNNESQDESHFNRKHSRPKNNDQSEEPPALAKIALDAFTKVTQATLAALIALVKLILQSIMMMFKNLMGMNRGSSFVSNLPDSPLLTYSNVIDRMRSTRTTTNDIEHSKGLDPKEAAADIADALNNEMSLKKTLKDELELSQVKPLDKLLLAKDALANLTLEDKTKLINEADILYSNLSADDKQSYLGKINIPVLHSVNTSAGTPLLSDPLVYDPRFGVLLGSSDRVKFNGDEYGVVSAAVVGGSLTYALAKENSDGHYDIKFAQAEDLTLTEHNAIQFDNFQNLKNHINEQIVEQFTDAEKIERLDLIERSELKGHEISIADLNDQINFIDFNKLGFDTAPVSVNELIENNADLSRELYYSLPQMHHDKTGDLYAPNKNNSHPFFGRLLDVNDRVEIQLDQSNINLAGSVIGAYEADCQLYYQVLHDNNFYSVKAEKVSLLKPNGGDLTQEQIDLMVSKNQAGKEFRIGSIAAQHEGKAHSIKLLTQADENGLNQSLQYIHHNDVIHQGGSNIGVIPLDLSESGEYTGAGKVYSLRGYDKDKTFFIALGETINPDTNMRKVVGVEVFNSLTGLRPVSAAKNRMVQLDMDDPNIKIEKLGLGNADLIEFMNKARAVYENGSTRRLATVMAHFVNEAKDKILGSTNEPLSFARESYLQNKVAMGLLQEQAGTIPTLPSMNIGLSANLAQSMINTEEIQKIIDQPQSRSYVPSQSLVTSTPADIVSVSMNMELPSEFRAASINDLISDYSKLGENRMDAPTSDSIGREMHQADEPFFDSVPGHDYPPSPDQVFSPDLDIYTPSLDSEQEIPHTDEPDWSSAPEHDFIPSPEPELATVSDIEHSPEVPIAPDEHGLSVHSETISNQEAQRLALFVETYVAGIPSTGEGHDVLELLSEKNRLSSNFDSLLEAAHEINTVLHTAVADAPLQNGFIQLDQLNAGEISALKTSLKDSEMGLCVNNIKEALTDLSMDFNEHINTVADHMSSISQDISFNELDDISKVTLDELNKSIKNDIETKIRSLGEIHNFSEGVDCIRVNKPESVPGLLKSIDRDEEKALMNEVSNIDAIFRERIRQVSNTAQQNSAEYGNSM